MIFQFRDKILSFIVSKIHPYIPSQLQKILSPDGLSSHLHIPVPGARQPQKGQRYACGILTSTALVDNHWQATDFVALRSLLGCPDENSFWLCGEDIRSGPGFVLGDPACDRIVFEPPSFEEVFDTSRPKAKLKLAKFWTTYTRRVKTLATTLTSDDTLFLVICGHGSLEGAIVVGNEHSYVEAFPSCLEAAVEGCKASVKLISTACHSAMWASQEWDLFAAAAEGQESVSMVESESGHCRGGFLTVASLAEHADSHGLQAPKPGSLTLTKDSDGEDTSIREPQIQHHFGPPYPGQRHPTPWLPKRTLVPQVLEWLHAFRDDMGRTYTSADFVFSPCYVGQDWEPLFSDLTNLPTIQHNRCQPPSGAAPSCSSLLGSLADTGSPLSKEDEEELLRLSQEHIHFLPPPTLSEAYLAQKCTRLVKHHDNPRGRLTNRERAKTLKALRIRTAHRELALIVAQKLGWEAAIERVGDPFGSQRRLNSDIPLQSRAVDNGYMLWDLHVFNPDTFWKGSAGWLARIWEAAGEPTIDGARWDDILRESRWEAERKGLLL